MKEGTSSGVVQCETGRNNRLWVPVGSKGSWNPGIREVGDRIDRE